MKESLKQDLNRSWVFVEQRDINEDAALCSQIRHLGLPSTIVDIHTHSGRKKDMGTIPLERLCRIKCLNNRRWYSLEQQRNIHREIFEDTGTTFWTFPYPFFETDIHSANNYLISNIQKQERALLLADQAHLDQTQQEFIDHQNSVIGVKAYYDQIPLNQTNNPESISNFEFFPRRLLKFLNDRSAIIMLHVSRNGGISHPDTLNEVLAMANDYPQLRIILAHMGRCYNPYKFKSVIDKIKLYPNVYFDSSMVDEKKVFERAIESVGPDRIMFGTDLPLSQVRFIRILEGEEQTTLSKQESWAIHIPHKPDVAIGMNVLYMTKALLQACQSAQLSANEINKIFSGNAQKIMQKD